MKISFYFGYKIDSLRDNVNCNDEIISKFAFFEAKLKRVFTTLPSLGWTSIRVRTQPDLDLENQKKNRKELRSFNIWCVRNVRLKFARARSEYVDNS